MQLSRLLDLCLSDGPFRSRRGAAVIAVAAIIGVIPADASHAAQPPSATMRFITGSPPVSHASGAGPFSLAFTSPRVGFAATTGGLRFVGRIGWARPIDRGRIEKTADGGTTWRTLWSANQVSFDAISVRGRTIVANGFVPRRHLRSVGYDPVARRVLVVSGDGGRTWNRLESPGSGQVQVFSSSTWILAVPSRYYPSRRAAVYRSQDAGHSWRQLSLPVQASAVRFITPRVGFAGGRQTKCRGGHQLWKTTDGAVTWRPLRGTCGSPLVALDAVSTRVLLAAQGSDDYSTGRNWSTVRQSMDGGSTWQTLWHEPNWKVIRLAFADARHGLVVEEQWHPGASGGCGFFRLRSTTDAGRTWSVRALPLSTSECTSGGTGGGPALPTAFSGTRYAWAGDEGAGVVWRTSDGGKTWRVSAHPQTLGYTILTGFDLALIDGGLVAGTAAGPAFSRDNGRTWRLVPEPSFKKVELASQRHRFRGPANVHLRTGQAYRTDGCRSVWRPTNRNVWLQCTPGEYNSLGFVLLTSNDGGGTWTLMRAPKRYITGFAAVGAREAWAYSSPWSYDAYSKYGEPRRLWHTTDGGATWERAWIVLPPKTRAAWVTTG